MWIKLPAGPPPDPTGRAGQLLRPGGRNVPVSLTADTPGAR